MDEPTLIEVAQRIARALERLAPPPATGVDLDAALALVWEARGERLRPVPRVAGVPLDLLCGIERVSELLFENTRRFAQGETIHTENSYKFRLDEFKALLAQAGFSKAQAWTDEQGWYAVVLARP